MNTIYRVVWNKSAGTWVVASEFARGRTKNSRAVVSAAALLIGAGLTTALHAQTVVNCTTDDGTSGRIQCGSSANASADNASAYGNSARASGQQSTAIGDQTLSSGSQSTAIGAGAGATATAATAIGFQSQASVQNATALGYQATATNNNATALGKGATAAGTGAVAIGGNATGSASAAAADSIAIGAQSSVGAAANSGIAVGRGATASVARSVALGDGATTATAVGTAGAVIRGTAYNFAGAAPVGTVSVGAANAERTVTNVAAGRLSGTSTDAVNGSQLFATNQAVENLTASSGTVDQTAVKYVWNDTNGNGAVDPGEVDYGRVVLAGPASTDGGLTNGTRVSNLAQGALSGTSTDAVNGAQLFQTNQSVAGLDTRVTATEGDLSNINNAIGPTDQSYQDTNGRGVRYVRTNDTGLGQQDAYATGARSTAAGYNARASAQDAIAIGALSEASKLEAIAIGPSAKGTGDFAIVLGADAQASGNHSLAVGDVSQASGSASMAVGAASVATASAATSVGTFSQATGAESVALGNEAAATADDAVAIGADSKASHVGSVALGTNSVADGSTLGNAAYLVGGTATGEVAIGNRRVTGVSAGAGDTDAVNVAQLKAVASDATEADQRAIKYDWNDANGNGAVDPGEVDYGKSTLAGPVSTDGGVTGGTRLSNVAQGAVSATSTDAVNGAQLHKTSQDVAGLDTRLTATEGNVTNLGNRTTTNEGDIVNLKNQVGPTDPAYLQQNGSGARYARTNDTGLAQDDAHAQVAGSTALGYNAVSSAADAVAIGRNAQASYAGSVALGAGSVANGGTLGNAAYLVGGTATGEVAIGNRRVTGVSAGAGDTDAVNVAQLKAVASDATEADQRAIKYDWNDANGNGAVDPGEVDYGKSTLAGPVSTDGGATGGTRLSNVAQGAVSATSTDAVNGAQLHKTNQDVAGLDTRLTTTEGNVANLGNRTTTNEGDIANLKNQVGPTDPAYLQQNGSGARYARTNDTGLAQDDAHAQVAGSTALGYNAVSSAADAVAIGRNAQASHAGSVALGAGSVANGGTLGNAAYLVGGTATGEVNVGNRRVTGVSAGASDTDAVNVAQLKAVASDATEADQRAVKYDWNDANGNGAVDAGEVDYGKSTLAGPVSTDGGVTGGTRLSNVSQGALSATSTDAVNGSQLFQTNQNVAGLDTRLTTTEGNVTNLGNRTTTNEGDITNLKNQVGPTDPAYLQQNGSGARYARTNDTGLAQDDAHAQVAGSTALGYNAVSSAADAVAIGRNAQASHAGSVALGTNSVADGSTLGNAAYLVGGTATGEVNVGNRRVTGVAAGAQDTDAVNVAQLKAVATGATQVEQRAVKYDWTDGNGNGQIDPGEVDYSKATLAGPASTDGGVTGGTRLSNVAQGAVSATSTDAVNGAQLYSVAGQSDAAYVGQNGRGLRYARSNDSGLAEADAHAQGVGSTAVGYNATSSTQDAVAIGRDSVAGHANSVALGAGSATTAGAQSGYNAAYVGSSDSTGQVQVGGRTVGGVAAGAAADDAVNVAQLQAGVNDAVGQANAYTDNRVNQVAGNVAQYDNRITTVEGDVNNVRNGAAGLFQVSQDNNAAPVVSGTNASAGGAGAQASGHSSTALGNGANASADNAVALGAGSVADQANTVAVGSAGSERRVTHVAAGTADTDAVNVAQLKGYSSGGTQYDKNPDGSNNTNSLTFNPHGTGQTTLHNVGAGVAPTDVVNVGQLNSSLADAVTQANSYTDGQVATVRNDVWKLNGDVRRLERNMHSGIATAIAIKPAPYVAGRTTYYAGFGAYKSEVAFGVSLRHTAEHGRWSLEGGASSNRDGIGAYVGVSGVLGD